VTVVWAFIRRDLLVETSYRYNLVIELFGGAFGLIGTYFLSATIGQGAPLLSAYGGDYFAFAVLGVAALGPIDTALMAMPQAIRDGQTDGTLEPILATPIDPLQAVFLQVAFPVAWGLVRTVVYVAAGAWFFDVPVHWLRLPLAIPALILGIAAYFALGLISAAFTLVLKRGDPVARVIEQVSWVFGGTLFPLAALPHGVQVLAWLLPVTHVLEIMRRVLLADVGVVELAEHYAVLGVLVAVLVPAGIGSFRYALGRARDDGSLAHS
jgi:ABC-2 type transport system permease protein